MLRILHSRWQQKHRTIPFPKQPPVLPARFRGLPVVDSNRCPEGCHECSDVCPTNAIQIEEKRVRIDLGRCLFCTNCTEQCAPGAIHFTQEPSLAARTRDDLILQDATWHYAKALEEKSRRLFGRSLKLRQVSAGGCNGCEVDVNVLGTVVFDLGRFGIQFVASPRHADGILLTGPVTENMHLALQKTYESIASPKLVIAVGACAISGGPYVDHPEVHNGATSSVPIDLFIPGCPPHPITILDGLLRLLGRIES